jgi:nicotinate-nucleotide adenylyltransferase
MIGILGGTFDPIHFVHLRTALDVLEGLGLDEVRFVPLKVAVHRDQPAAPGELRLEMVRAAIAGQRGFAADDRELRRDGPSYTLHTLESLRAEHGDRPLCLLLGGDAFRGFPTWHRPERIVGLAHLVIMQRPGAEVPRDPQLRPLLDGRLTADPARLRAAPAGSILFFPVTQLAISATDIRDRVARGLSPRYLMPDAVQELVQREGLYADAR